MIIFGWLWLVPWKLFCRETLELKAITFLEKKGNLTAIYIAQIIQRQAGPSEASLEQRIADVKNLCQSYLPEMQDFFAKLIEDLVTLLRRIGCVDMTGLFDRTTTFHCNFVERKLMLKENKAILDSHALNIEDKRMNWKTEENAWKSLRYSLKLFGYNLSAVTGGLPQAITKKHGRKETRKIQDSVASGGPKLD